MAIKHAATKSSGSKGLASEWNDAHIIGEGLTTEQEDDTEESVYPDWTDVPILEKAITLTETAKIIILANLRVYTTTLASDNTISIRLVKDGVYIPNTLRKQKVNAANSNITISTQTFLELGSGNYTLKMQGMGTTDESFWEERSLIILVI